MPKFRLKSPRISENDVEHGIQTVLQVRGYRPVRMNSALVKIGERWVRFGEKGFPDWIGIHEYFPGVLVEAKSPDGELKPDQQTKIWELQAGFRLNIAVVDDPKALSQFLDEHEQRAVKRLLEKRSM